MQSHPPASPRQVLLGLLICLQLAYIVVSNLLGFFTWYGSEQIGDGTAILNRLAPGFADKKGHGWEWCDNLEVHVFLPWSQLNRQDKIWSMFAPNVSKATGFPALLLVDDAAENGRLPDPWVQVYDDVNGHHIVSPGKEGKPGRGEILLADTEPADIHHFLRIGNSRIERYEEELYVNPAPWVDPDSGRQETSEETAKRITRRVADKVENARALGIAYMKWRLGRWQEQHPDRALPKQVILIERYYRIHDPEQAHGWDGPFMVPIARWQPVDRQAHADIVLEPYDFTKRRFTRP